MNESLLNKRIYFTDVVVFLTMLNALGLPGNYATLLGGAMIQTVFDYCVFFLQIVLIFINIAKGKWRFVEHEAYLYIFLVFITVESLIVTHYMQEQLISCVRFSVLVLFSVFLVKHYSLENLNNLICAVFIFFVFATIVICVLSPSLAFEDKMAINGAIRGISSTKNECGGKMALALIFFVLRFRLFKRPNDSKTFKCVIIGATFLILVLSQCTAALLFGVVSVLYILFWPPAKRYNLTFVFIVVSIGFLVLAMTSATLFGSVLELLGKDSELTGRTELWAQAINVIFNGDQNLTGYGYAMFWRDPVAYSQIQSVFGYDTWFSKMTDGGHNLLIDYALNVGILGVLALFVMMIPVFSGSKKMDNRTWIVASSLFLYLMLIGLTERFFVVYSIKLITFFVVGALCLQNDAKSIRPGKIVHPGILRNNEIYK